MWTSTFFLFIFLAQEIPPQTDNPPAQAARIVEDRPDLYLIKHRLHPLTWLEHGVRPMIRSGESGFIHRVSLRRPRPPLQFGLDGMGPGSGFGPKIGLAEDNGFGRGIKFQLSTLYTYTKYQAYAFDASVPLASEGIVDRLTFDIGTAYRSRAGDHFFGLGNDSDRVQDSHFRTVNREAKAGFSVQLDQFWKAGLHARYQNVGVTHPSAGASAQDLFRNAAVPGLFTGGILRSASLSLEHNTKNDERMPWHGGSQRIEAGRYDSVRKGNFAYWKYRFDFEHFFGLTKDHRTVIAVRGLAETNQENRGSQVPFFDMPFLGTWNTMRGFENYRFRDKSALAAGIEYRYRIWERLDWGFFVDGGQVAPELGDLSLNRFHTSYGGRLIMLPTLKFPIVWDIARSREGWRFYINFGHTF